MKSYLVFIVFSVVFFSCSKDDEAENVPPSSLTYNTQNVFIKNTSVVNLVPTSTGGAVTSYSISPALPEGLSFNTETGVISGTPTVTVATTTYTVTATNSGGSTSFDFVVTVSDALPVSLSYNAQNVFIKNTSVVNLIPTISGGDSLNYTIIPALPEGLSLNTTTGVISGMPTIISSPTTYVVTASNSVGATSFEMVITVNDIAPSSLSYNNVQQVFFKNDPIVNLIPMISGGAVSSYSISPALPNGLSINVATGVISGTPTVAAAMTTYTVTATNASGSSSFGVVITVNNQPSRIVQTIETFPSNFDRITKVYSYQNSLMIKVTTYRAYYHSPTSIVNELYSYENGKLMSTQGIYTGIGSITTNYFYTNDLITSDATPYWNTTTTYGYDSNDRLVSVNGVNRYEYYPDGNLYKQYASDPANDIIYSSYDTKNNPFRLGGFTSEYLKFYRISFNNPTSMNNETYVYEYNAFDYPTKKTTYINGVVRSITTYTYE